MAKKLGSKLPKRKGEFTFRGKTLEQLQALSLEEFTELLTARERRSIRRGFNDHQKDVMQQVKDGASNVRTHYRNVIILPDMVGKTVSVYNGKSFLDFEIQPEMIGHRFGEFALSRSKVSHGSAGVGATRSSRFVPLK
ncbi:MAG: 30S ribosomal protein S19 [Methanomethylovorans sp.]|jgi:small subunit ribosomal protein S19|uniref:30S ribosomal protein S19 n=1 Tax=Methanomethylovorans sp. TaxID=2758717 RepID=UPI0009C8ABC5|nr:MAG: 30S ribosomal protein S19 [Methanomethylovorans sp. PtaU1.Bin073]